MRLTKDEEEIASIMALVVLMVVIGLIGLASSLAYKWGFLG